MPRKGAKFHARRFSRFVFKAEKRWRNKATDQRLEAFSSEGVHT
jgi:hypothetical protein